jgi:hypothetical protein
MSLYLHDTVLQYRNTRETVQQQVSLIAIESNMKLILNPDANEWICSYPNL